MRASDNAVGLFEAKTKLSEICEGVARTRRPVVITRRGRPLVRIEPIAGRARRQGVWEARAAYVAAGGKLPARIELPARTTDDERALFD
jgi:prevent-host-death family protein